MLMYHEQQDSDKVQVWCGLGLGRLGVGRGLLGETLPTLGALAIFERCWRGDSAGLFLGVADADIAVESCRE